MRPSLTPRLPPPRGGRKGLAAFKGLIWITYAVRALPATLLMFGPAYVIQPLPDIGRIRTALIRPVQRTRITLAERFEA